MYNIQQAWDAYARLRGFNHHTVKPYVRQCNTEQERKEGYWPSPWIEMPAGGEPFDVVQAITTPAAGSAETVVLSYRIPFGFDGVILGIGNEFTGPGFVESSGDLIWRIRTGQPGLAGRPVRNYSNITTTFGSTSGPREVYGGIIVDSSSFITYTVTHAAGSGIVPAGTRIFCTIAGFYWPRGAAQKKT